MIDAPVDLLKSIENFYSVYEPYGYTLVVRNVVLTFHIVNCDEPVSSIFRVYFLLNHRKGLLKECDYQKGRIVLKKRNLKSIIPQVESVTKIKL